MKLIHFILLALLIVYSKGESSDECAEEYGNILCEVNHCST